MKLFKKDLNGDYYKPSSIELIKIRGEAGIEWQSDLGYDVWGCLTGGGEVLLFECKTILEAEKQRDKIIKEIEDKPIRNGIGKPIRDFIGKSNHPNQNVRRGAIRNKNK